MLLYLRYRRGQKWVRERLNEIPEIKIDPDFLGEVESVKITFLVDYYPVDERFKGEPGVSYHVNADGYRVLFDTGFNASNEEPSPLLHNASLLNIKLPEEIDAVVISHMHLDHIGGMRNQIRRTFSLSRKDLDLTGKIAFVPVKMSHPTADVVVNSTPTIISKGVLVTEPLPSMLYFMGKTLEQALVINLKGRGLVVIVGCGHQKVQNLVNYLEKLVPVKIYAVIGGVHLPVTQSRETRFGLPVQKILGTGKPPWNSPSRKDVEDLIQFLKEKGVKKVGISAHDSCDYTLGRFREEWGNDYIEIKAGSSVEL